MGGRHPQAGTLTQGEGPVSVSENCQEGDHNPGVREAGAGQALVEDTWCPHRRSEEFKCDSDSQEFDPL